MYIWDRLAAQAPLRRAEVLRKSRPPLAHVVRTGLSVEYTRDFAHALVRYPANWRPLGDDFISAKGANL